MKKYKLYSFDIFDTLITRKVANPSGIFALMQYKLKFDSKFINFSSDIKENFFKYRTNSEYRLRCLNNQCKNGTDVKFEQIYEAIKETCALTEKETSVLMNLEIETELENIIPIPENIVKLKSLLNSNEKVVLISDMYLSEELIKLLLQKCDSVLCSLPIYVSSESGFMKSKKELFKFVKEKENIEYNEWYHFGDNAKSDYSNPAELGISAEKYNYISLKSYENNLLKKAFENPYVQLSIGNTKNIRLFNRNLSAKYQLGLSLAAPIFYPYIKWLLNQVQKRNIKRLYFIARDGFILKNIFDRIIKNKNLDIETNYIYGSRLAWQKPALTLTSDELYKQFITKSMWNYKKIDEMLGIEKQFFLEILPAHLHKYSKKLSIKKQDELKNFLLNDKRILNKIIENNIEKRNEAIEYLKQEINCSDDSFAFVDLDGSGLTQNCLKELMNKFYKKDILSFYFSSTPAIFNEINVKRIFYYAIRKPNLGNLLELLTKAPHGQTLGYRCINNIWQPILEEVSEEQIKKMQIDEFMNGVFDYVDSMEKYNYANNYNNVPHTILNSYTEFIYSNIDKDTANLLGSTVHSLYGSEVREFAKKIKLNEAIKYVLTNKIDTENLYYSKTRSSNAVKKLITFKQKNPSLRKNLINVMIHKKEKKAFITILGIKISFRHLLWKK